MTFATRTAFSFKAAMYLGVAALAVSAGGAVQAQAAEAKQLDIPAQALANTLTQIGRQTGSEVVFQAGDVRGRNAPAVRGALTAGQALDAALRGSGLRARHTAQGAFVIERAATSSGDQADSSGYAANEIVVTAQKRVESIQDVPISVSAFSAKSLDEQKIEGGSELVRAVPNVSFSKTNFASYNFSIRGVGTKALSVASDPAVAISFNNTPLIRNRLFEQEYFDVERVEVLRGPQGTLYGRNATGGVVNMIPNIAEPGDFSGDLQLEAGNYGSMRAKGMLNVPLGDTLAVRAAGAWTSRNGYDFNTVTNRRVNGRDLWSTRISAAWEPSDSFRVNAIWEHFYENDDRSRTGKQLCTRDSGPSSIGGVDISENVLARGLLSQGCMDSTLYDDAAFGVPNGFALPYVTAAATLGSKPN
jgi:outer membrane receptor protein involved in Fe transport